MTISEITFVNFETRDLELYRMNLVAFCSGHLYIATGGNINVYSMQTNRLILIIPIVTQYESKEYCTSPSIQPPINYIKGYPNDNVLIVVDDLGYTTRLCTRTNKVQIKYESIDQSAWSCAINRDKMLVGVTGNDKCIHLYNYSRRERIHVIRDAAMHNIPAIAFSRDLLSIVSIDSRLYTYSLVDEGFKRMDVVYLGEWGWSIHVDEVEGWTLIGTEQKLILLNSSHELVDECEVNVTSEHMRITEIKKLNRYLYLAIEQYHGQLIVFECDGSRIVVKEVKQMIRWQYGSTLTLIPGEVLLVDQGRLNRLTTIVETNELLKELKNTINY